MEMSPITTPPLVVTEVDGVPSIKATTELVFTNASITQVGSRAIIDITVGGVADGDYGDVTVLAGV